MCKFVLVSNGNPNHSIDPNSCIKRNKNNCFGELNKTCNVPKKIEISNISNVRVVTFWESDIIKKHKRLYYYNYLPIYSNSHHFSNFYLKLIIHNIIHILSKYVNAKNNLIDGKKCKYYQLFDTYFVYKSLNKEKCFK